MTLNFFPPRTQFLSRLIIKSFSMGCYDLAREPRFWSSWKGQIIRAIVLDGVYTRNGLLKTTGLNETQFETALDELFHAELLIERGKGRLWVNSSELCNEYREFFEKIQETLIDWLYKWRRQKRINTELNHFFLEDKLLDELSEKLIEQANVDVLVVNPFVERCHLSNTLKSAIAKGISVRLVTRSPTSEKYQYQEKKQKYHSKLKEEGVSITYDDSVHAKLIVADRAVAIVSSMNFVASSSGGASYEAGLVTVERNVVQSVARSIINRL